MFTKHARSTTSFPESESERERVVYEMGRDTMNILLFCFFFFFFFFCLLCLLPLHLRPPFTSLFYLHPFPVFNVQLGRWQSD